MRTLLAMTLATGILLTFSGCGSDCGTSFCSAPPPPAPRIQTAAACSPCDAPPMLMPSVMRPTYAPAPVIPANPTVPFNGI